jgi:phospholipase/lecithinase/hemolysin
MKKTVTIINTLLLFSLISTPVWSYPYTDIYVFGDSLSDTGRYFEATGKPPTPYYQGHFSNGKVWVEQLAEALSIIYNPRTNYAWGGATTGTTNVNGDFPGLQTQINDYLKDTTAADANALYVVWAGANDFLSGLENPAQMPSIISTAVTNIVSAVTKLRNHQAEHILVLNLPDIGKVPRGLASGMADQLTQLSTNFNQALASGLQPLATIQIDSFALLNALADSSKSTLAFAHLNNVTDACVDLEKAKVCNNSAEYLFWDAIHPTTVTHRVLALVVEAAVAEPYYIDFIKFTPSNGSWLHLPLVEVNKPTGKEMALHTIMFRDPYNTQFNLSVMGSNLYFAKPYSAFITTPTTSQYPTFDSATGHLHIPVVHVDDGTIPTAPSVSFIAKYSVDLNLVPPTGNNPFGTTVFNLTNATLLKE